MCSKVFHAFYQDFLLRLTCFWQLSNIIFQATVSQKSMDKFHFKKISYLPKENLLSKFRLMSIFCKSFNQSVGSRISSWGFTFILCAGMGDLRIYAEFRIFFFYLCGGKKKPEPGKLTIFIREKNSGMMWHYCRLATHPDLIQISRFFSTNLEVSWLHVWKSLFFLFCFEIRKIKRRLTLSHVPCLQKPTKCGLKINFLIGWIDGFGWILCTPRLSEWSRLGIASLSPRPSLTWCHSSADPRNSAVFCKGSSHFFSVCNDLGHENRESSKSEIYNSAELRNQGSYEFFEAYLQFHFREATLSVTNNFFFLWVFN